MGIRGELFSTRITTEGRTYFFNVKENRMGDVFLTIVESKPTETETFDRRSIVVFREDMRGFLKAFQGALKFMEKPGSKADSISFKPEEGEVAPSPRWAARAEKEARAAAAAAAAEAGVPAPDEDSAEPAGKKRRIVVKRKPASKA
jgi:hypothetical protein